MGGISQAKRIDIYSRQDSHDAWLHTYIDLDEIEAQEMEHIPAPQPTDLPDGCEDLVGAKGTLVVWSKTDRLEESESGGGRQATKVESDLVCYIARTFRKFIDAGRTITLSLEKDGKPAAETEIFPHDPLFLMDSMLTRREGEPHKPATVVVNESFDFEIPGQSKKSSKVEAMLTLLPETTRKIRGQVGQ